jgi:hypothetical protein
MRLSTPVLLLALCAALGGCTQIRIYSDGAVEVHHVVGLAQVDVPPASVSYVETTGAGVVVGRRHVSLGWMTESTALVPDARQCVAIVVAENAQAVAGIEDVLKRSESSLGNICVMGRPQ